MHRRHHEELGTYLRECRESLGFKIDEISDQLNIRPSYIQDIERGRFSNLPGSVYAEGYLKSYAEILKLNPKDILERFRSEGGANDDEPQAEFALPESYGDGMKPSALILVCMLTMHSCRICLVVQPPRV